MSNYIVYMHISPSNKRYIGITCKKKPEYRWNNGKGYKENNYFTKAINKYSWDNFEHIIIAKGLTEDEAKWLEIELIREWDSANRNKGYNITLGGEGTNGYKHTEESRKKISENHADMSGENNPNYGKTFSEEHRQKISQALSGRVLSDETIKKRSGKNHPRAKAVICLTTMKTFDTAKEGAEFYGIKSNSHILACCKGYRKSCGKLSDGTKLVWKYLVDYLAEQEINIENLE